ncbi:MAG: nucleotide exchange factor GrpE [Patescibacteria group bacterium]
MEEQPRNDVQPQEVSEEMSLEAMRTKCEEYLAGWKRSQADYQNSQREAEYDRKERTKYANERLLHGILPMIDQLARAMAFVPDTSTLPEEQRKIWENWLMGVRAVQQLWEQNVQTFGLTRIPAEGSFDPSLHEAAGQESVEGKETDTILRVLEDGWKLHDKVLRPAKVVIAT